MAALVLVERVGEVALLRLNDEATLNALSPAMADDLRGALVASAADCRAILLTGAGRAFCSGANIGGGSAAGPAPDVGDIVRTADVGFTAFVRMRRDAVIDNANIQAGDVVVGLASSGKATYENAYNGGMGSNGLTSARHDVFSTYIAQKYPESYDNSLASEIVYSGSLKPTDKVAVEYRDPDGSMKRENVDAARLVLSPTRTYAPVVLAVLNELRPHIHGMVHCSGGGQTKVLHFIDNLHIVKDNLFAVPPLFSLIQRESGTDWHEMYKVFNMGHRMEIYLPEAHAQRVIDLANSFNIGAQIVGRVETSAHKKLTIRSPHGEFEYA